jgi:glycerol-3-phosphate acyltransferase PlsX
VGSEPSKGNEVVIEAYQLLKQGDLNFSGNIEGREIFQTDVDVIVCDGFVGNITLKATEGIVAALMTMMRAELRKNPLRVLGGVLAKPGIKDIVKKLDYSEYGGAPLLGVEGVSIICHGSSKARAIRNAIRYAYQTAQSEMLDMIARGFHEG